MESICLYLEQAFQASDAVCACCQQDVARRCLWCVHAYGWHRCQCHMDEKSLKLSDPSCFRWKPNTLYDTAGCDVDACVLSMLARAVNQKKIFAMLDNLFTHQKINRTKHEELVRLVKARTQPDGFVDSAAIYPQASGATPRCTERSTGRNAEILGFGEESAAGVGFSKSKV